MPFLPSSGAISIADLNTFFPGSGTAMSNFYRGGARVPSSKTVLINRQPSSGEFYLSNSSGYVWAQGGFGTAPDVFLIWGSQLGTFPVTANTATTGGWTYFRGTFRQDAYDQYGQYIWSEYAIYRGQYSTTNINTGIPTSGQISLSQFYGAEVP